MEKRFDSLDPLCLIKHWHEIEGIKEKIMHLLNRSNQVGLLGQAIAECTAEYGEEITSECLMEYKILSQFE